MQALGQTSQNLSLPSKPWCIENTLAPYSPKGSLDPIHLYPLWEAHRVPPWKVHYGSIQFTFPWLGDSCESIRHLLSPPLFVLELQSCLSDSEGVLFHSSRRSWTKRYTVWLNGAHCSFHDEILLYCFWVAFSVCFYFLFACLFSDFWVFLFVFQGRLHWQRTDVKGQGNKWDQDVWCEIRRESVKAEKIDR